MTDISHLFKRDDTVFDLPIIGRDPETGEDVDTGVVFKIRSLRNDDALNVVKKKRNELFGKKMLTKEEVAHDEVGALLLMETTDPTDEQLATCVVGWEWGGKTFGALSTKHSFANVEAIFKAAPWIKMQVLQKVVSITDFTKA